MITEQGPVMAVPEMAKLLGLHPTTIRALARAKKIPGGFRLGDRFFFSRARFEEFLRDPDGSKGGESHDN